jgi:hypothetical protein
MMDPQVTVLMSVVDPTASLDVNVIGRRVILAVYDGFQSQSSCGWLRAEPV